MKKYIFRAVSAVLIFAMAAFFAACSKSGKVRKVKADTPWYDTEVIKVDLGIDQSRGIFHCDSKPIGSDDRNYYVLSDGLYSLPEGNVSIAEANKAVIAVVAVIDKESGATVKTIDLNGEIADADRVLGSSYENGKVTIHIESIDPKTGDSKIIDKCVNIENGNVMVSKEYSKNDLRSIERSYNLGDYRVDVSHECEERESIFNIMIISPDGNTQKTVLKEPGVDLYGISAIFITGDTTALAVADKYAGYSYFEIDLKNCNAKMLDPNDYEWINANDWETALSVNGENYYTSSGGIFRLDFVKKTAEQILDFSSCGVNRTFLEQLNVADKTGDSYILCGQYSPKYIFAEDGAGYYIVKLNKAATNPHAGKTILDLYVPDGTTNNRIIDAVIKFNETNTDCFIEVTNKYQTINDDDHSEKTYDDQQLNKNLAISTSLAMDIMNGDGPDIIMNASVLGQLNNSCYLMDLAPYFKDLDSSKYFTNIIEASKTDGKLYQMPLCFKIKGIHTDRNNAGASGVGFTTEEYEKFIHDVLNGSDIINADKAHYFAQLFNAMHGEFIKEGKADFTGPEFAELAEFVKGKNPEKPLSYDGDVQEPNRDTAVYTESYGLLPYFYNVAQIKGDISILGIPSSDGRGPLFRAYISAAVSAQSHNVEASVEFIKILLSDEIQENLAMQENYVLNRAAFRKACGDLLEHYNDTHFDNLFGRNSSGILLEHRYKFSEKNIDDLENVILSCSGMDSEDQAISIILIEEMPAYFTGQKSLDEVIKIAQDRAQKVLDERK